MIRSINTNSNESYTVMYSRQHEDRILDFEADNSYWGTGHYCTQVDLTI